jgi:hypothetical protein
LKTDGSLMLSDSAALVMLRYFETAPNARIWLSVMSSPVALPGLLYDCPERGYSGSGKKSIASKI